MKKKIVIAVVGFALAVLLGLSVYQSPAYKKNLAELEQVCAELEHVCAELEQVCAELTKNDPDGRVYEPIVGQYKWKSYSTVEYSTFRTIYAHEFTLKVGDDEIEAYSPVMSEEEYNSVYMPILKKRISGFSELDKPSEYSKKVYGVCGYLDKDASLVWGKNAPKVRYENKIETLMLVKE